jgi:hypothetical protein
VFAIDAAAVKGTVCYTGLSGDVNHEIARQKRRRLSMPGKPGPSLSIPITKFNGVSISLSFLGNYQTL